MASNVFVSRALCRFCDAALLARATQCQCCSAFPAFDSIAKQRTHYFTFREASRPAARHASRTTAPEASRGKRALRNATVFVCVPLARNLSSRSASLRRSSHKAPGPRFRDPADFFRSPLDPFGTELLKRRRFFLRTGVLHSSHRRQRLIVAADGDPKPPQIAAANRDRRRRPFPATRTPLDAPSMETAIRNIVLSYQKVN
jgi:hypothetical protein